MLTRTSADAEKLLHFSAIVESARYRIESTAKLD
jgi:hypothetical protein